MNTQESLIKRAQQGDLDAYGQIIRQFQTLAIGYAHHLLRDEHLAEDAAQEAFLQVYLHLKELREPAAFKGWLRKIVFKCCNRITRRAHFRTTALEKMPDLATQDPEPDDWTEHREIQNKLHEAIGLLSHPEREVTKLFYIDGYPQHQIGNMLNISAQTVKSRLYSARQRLKKRMIAMTDDQFAEAVIDRIKIVEHRGKYYPSQKTTERAHIKTVAEYERLYQQSIETPDTFWAGVANTFHWFRPWNQVRSFNYDCNKGPISTRWFDGATTNMAYNCLDRHLNSKPTQNALIWEGDGASRTLTYQDLHREVCRCANALKSLGIKSGNVVTLYMPMIPELPIAMLACTRIGAIHHVVFSGCDQQQLADRLHDSQSHLLITASGTYSNTELVNLKKIANQAIELAKSQGTQIEACVVVERDGFETDNHSRDHSWTTLLANANDECPCEPIDSESPLFMLYTGNSEDNLKGIVHTTGGYMVYAGCTHKYIFDYHDQDVFFCVADIGWITGHTYGVYGPLLNGGTTLITEHAPKSSIDTYWQLIASHNVSQFYTAPAHIHRMIDANTPNGHDLSSLKLIGTVGEPISPEAWHWAHQNIGHERCPIVNTWWQTETGGALIASLPGALPTKPGASSLPFFGVKPAILDLKTGRELTGNNVEGLLAIAEPWPGQIRTLYNNTDLFEETYFKPHPGYYITGDGCRRDEDGYYWITGRIK